MFGMVHYGSNWFSNSISTVGTIKTSLITQVMVAWYVDRAGT